MSVLSLTLLGDVACALDGRPLHFARRSGLALAFYLACMGRAQSRAVLTTLLAGDSAEAGASMTLRNALRDLRAVLGDELQVNPQSVALASTLALESDVTTFETVAQTGLEHEFLDSLRSAVARSLNLAVTPGRTQKPCCCAGWPPGPRC
jgi:DNA-binding SARP family transcriptional activator